MEKKTDSPDRTVQTDSAPDDSTPVEMTDFSVLQRRFLESTHPRIRKAFEIARKAHAGQVDKAGTEYIRHPVTVASGFGDDESAVIVALLHDVVEDTAYTSDRLKREVPLTDEELHALQLVTHGKGLSDTEYLENIRRIRTDPLASRVKLADLTHNSDISRIPENLRTDRVLRNIEKYHRAIEILRS